MRFSVFFLVILASAVSTICYAKKEVAPAIAPVEASLKSQALAESKIEGLAKKSATDAQVPGMLTLQDPRPEIITRKWIYTAAFSAQMFRPEGLAYKEGSGTFNLSQQDQTVMPAIEMGVLSPSLQTNELQWKFGVRAKAGFASQGTSVKLQSGYIIDDARINTTVLGAGPLVSLQWERLNWLTMNLGSQLGSVNYTQTSANEFAAFSKQGGFDAVSLGLDFALTKKWLLTTEWTQRNLRDNSEIALQKDNFELGTKITW